MKVLFYHSCSYLNPHTSTIFDEIQVSLDKGDDVVLLICGKGLKGCFRNLHGEKLVCGDCVSLFYKFLEKLSRPIKVLYLSDIATYKKYEFKFQTKEELAKLHYKGVSIGYSFLSSYISVTRNLNPLINISFKDFAEPLINSTYYLTDCISIVTEDIKPDEVVLYNGRFFEARPVLDYCIAKGIPTRVCEVIGGIGDQPFSKVYFRNCLPHDIVYNTNIIKNFWIETKNENKEQIASSFYTLKKQGKSVTDKSYVTGQQIGVLPLNWDPKKKNIVIFNSSEDEFASIGDSWGLFFHKSQIEGIIDITESLAPYNEYHVYLRIHPNLKNIAYRYHTDLYLLEKQFANITVISADDKISTYSLIDHADKIVVFGSTVGVEACFWRKPVILLGSALYQFLNVTYNATSTEKLKELLVSNLNAKPLEGALMYSFYYIGNRGEPYIRFSPQAKHYKRNFFIRIYYKMKQLFFANIPRKENLT